MVQAKFTSDLSDGDRVFCASFACLGDGGDQTSARATDGMLIPATVGGVVLNALTDLLTTQEVDEVLDAMQDIREGQRWLAGFLEELGE